MAERRSIDEALTLPAEAVAFIHGNQAIKTAEADASRGSAKAGRKPGPASEETQEPEDSSRNTEQPKKRVGRRRRTQQVEKTADSQAEPGLVGQLLVPVTTRLRPKTAEALRRACLEQKLSGRRPHTQQDIIEAAAQAWLRENGFLQ